MGAGASTIPPPFDSMEAALAAGKTQEEIEAWQVDNANALAPAPSTLEALWQYAPAGAREPKVAQMWGMVSGGWAMMGQMPPEGFIAQVRMMASMFDQSPDNVERCIVEETTINDKPCLVYTPKTMADTTAKPCLVFYHGGGFIASSPEHWKKKCSTLAMLTNAVVVCPFIGVGPAQQGSEWIANGVQALKWTHEHSEARGIDKMRIGIIGESHGAWTALQVCKTLATTDDSGLVKVSVLDIPAIENDFCQHAADPTQEVLPMHQACSKLHLLCWATLFTKGDVAAASTFDWSARASDHEVFPAQMSDELLKKIPPQVILTGEFDHVGLRGSQQFAARMKEKAAEKLLGLYVQPGVGHGMYGDKQQDRDEALALICGTYL